MSDSVNSPRTTDARKVLVYVGQILAAVIISGLLGLVWYITMSLPVFATAFFLPGWDKASSAVFMAETCTSSIAASLLIMRKLRRASSLRQRLPVYLFFPFLFAGICACLYVACDYGLWYFGASASHGPAPRVGAIDVLSELIFALCFAEINAAGNCYIVGPLSIVQVWLLTKICRFWATN